MKFTTVMAFTVISLLLASGLQATPIDYPGNGNGLSFWGPSSIGNQSYGEVFTAPQAVLDDYSLTVESDNPFPFLSQVYAWDGTEATGSALFTSGTETTTTSFTTYTFSPGIALTPGDQYIAFVTNQPGGVSLGGSGYGTMEGTDDPNAPSLMFAEGDPSAPGNWFVYQPTPEFQADFSDAASAPEPATFALVGLGLTGLGLLRRKQ